MPLATPHLFSHIFLIDPRLPAMSITVDPEFVWPQRLHNCHSMLGYLAHVSMYRWSGKRIDSAPLFCTNMHSSSLLAEIDHSCHQTLWWWSYRCHCQCPQPSFWDSCFSYVPSCCNASTQCPWHSSPFLLVQRPHSHHSPWYIVPSLGPCNHS